MNKNYKFTNLYDHNFPEKIYAIQYMDKSDSNWCTGWQIMFSRDGNLYKSNYFNKTILEGEQLKYD